MDRREFVQTGTAVAVATRLPLRLPQADASIKALCIDRKSTRLNSSHRCTSYAAFCVKKKGAPQVGQPVDVGDRHRQLGVSTDPERIESAPRGLEPNEHAALAGGRERSAARLEQHTSD